MNIGREILNWHLLFVLTTFPWYVIRTVQTRDPISIIGWTGGLLIVLTPFLGDDS